MFHSSGRKAADEVIALANGQYRESRHWAPFSGLNYRLDNVFAHIQPCGFWIQVHKHAGYFLHRGQYFDHLAASFGRAADIANASSGFYKLRSRAGSKSFDQNVTYLLSASSRVHPRGQGTT